MRRSTVRKQQTPEGFVAVTFTVLATHAARRACLISSCTAWTELAMHPRADGGFELIVELPPGARHVFRYWLDDERWENDPDADEEVVNPYGSTDSVVTT